MGRIAALPLDPLPKLMRRWQMKSFARIPEVILLRIKVKVALACSKPPSRGRLRAINSFKSDVLLHKPPSRRGLRAVGK